MGRNSGPAELYCGAQTQLSLENFPIGTERMPDALIRAFGMQKSAVALANMNLGVLDRKRGKAIERASKEVASGKLLDHFPLVVWQTGSGTQSNMKVNEAIANRANEILGQKLGAMDPVHPNDHVDLGQSSNDSFPTAMHIAAVGQLNDRLLPALARLRASLAERQSAFSKIVKTGRTHLQNATPLTLGQKFSAFVAQIDLAAEHISTALPGLRAVARGGTAVGTGLNAVRGFDKRFCVELQKLTGTKYVTAPNKFEALAAHDAIVEMSSVLNVLATSLMKTGKDIRLLSSGPLIGSAHRVRAGGLGKISLPANEPGSSTIPGKTNPTEAEALTMVCV